jgi:hypothetical protein
MDGDKKALRSREALQGFRIIEREYIRRRPMMLRVAGALIHDLARNAKPARRAYVTWYRCGALAAW